MLPETMFARARPATASLHEPEKKEKARAAMKSVGVPILPGSDGIVESVGEAEEWARLKRRDRRVIAAGDLSDRHIAALRDARVPDQHADLDRELKDWKP